MATKQLTFNPDGPIPRHVAIIMDGNGRWATARGLERTAGHKEGLNAVRRVAVAAAEIGVKVLSLYAFSTENWKRPSAEVRYLMSLPDQMEQVLLPDLMAHNVRVRMMGFEKRVPSHTLSAIRRAEKQTQKNDGLLLNVAFNYGGRAELTTAMRVIATEVANGELAVDAIDADTISRHLLTGVLPDDFQDPDFLIRSSGEQRLSNFMLWQLAYTELAFPTTYWPDFDRDVFLNCIADFQQRQRRFGGLAQ